MTDILIFMSIFSSCLYASFLGSQCVPERPVASLTKMEGLYISPDTLYSTWTLCFCWKVESVHQTLYMSFCLGIESAIKQCVS